MSVKAQQPTQKPHNYSLWNIWVAGFFLKLLLFTTYHSTDFDVHRNWLAITNGLPMNKWYYEATSQWTLDYPPFFAYFEWVLSQFVPQLVKDDGCLDIVEVGEYSLPTVFYQRLTVIVSEILLFAMLQWYINTCESDKARKGGFVVASSIALSPGFLIIDHIHFQYNGFLFGLIVGSIVAAKQQYYLLCGGLFAVALCFKHIFLYLAPAYFVFLLRGYCLNLPNHNISLMEILEILGLKAASAKYKPVPIWKIINWGNLLKLGSLVIMIFAVAFVPFGYPENQLPQLLTRLFPFSRGLTHAYWAPNIWALYSFSDRILSQLALHLPGFANLMVKFGFPQFARDVITSKIIVTSNTKGLVQDVLFTVLPDISPRTTFSLTLFYQILAVFPLACNPSYARFLGSLTLCGFASFLFGWHVHEKAIMLVIVPFSFVAVRDRRFLSSFVVLAASGYVSLFPLLFTPELWTLKLLYTLVWFLIYYASFREVAKTGPSQVRRIFFFDRLTLIYIAGLLPLVVVCGILDVLGTKAGALGRLEFLRLMFISVYCSIGVVGSWIGLSWLYFFDELLWTD
ncbi:dolichyl-P-Glc:Glc1Man(9)GlcNAc(2)-PP-dolichol alpha-1,3-glucosyltransferase [Saccharomycopsis crataegensis]|uniref:Alpha-1,3-glucosyltransferase n=1 Tax=Saccharomycopsis crataegensis TaxID=43959 RepID=A0AAV5QGX0_9ASCO|nr:dolichyl-P-Glc:Glc1Man(9)GlcNAc(2)-PP-dolichol alpha-1,3-glucosyltransferase [Saccharomycopsis crataegensis]